MKFPFFNVFSVLMDVDVLLNDGNVLYVTYPCLIELIYWIDFQQFSESVGTNHTQIIHLLNGS